MRNRIRYTTFFLILILSMIPIVCVLMLQHLNQAETLSRMGSGAFGEIFSTVKIDDTIDASTLISAVECEAGRCALYYETEDNAGTIRYIYFNKSYIHLPLKSGRFFMQSDFNKGENFAVVGKGREREIQIDQSGERVIIHEDKKYNVIGVLGYDQPTVLDDYVFLNLDSIDEIDSPLVIIDYFGSAEDSDPSESFRSSLKTAGFYSRHVSTTESFNESVMPQIISSRWFAAVLLCCLILAMLSSIQWTHSQVHEISVRILVGASPMRISALVIGKYIAIAFTSFAVGAAYCLMKYPDYIWKLLKGYAVSGVFLIAFILWSTHYLTAIDIQEALK